MTGKRHFVGPNIQEGGKMESGGFTLLERPHEDPQKKTVSCG